MEKRTQIGREFLVFVPAPVTKVATKDVGNLKWQAKAPKWH